MASLSRERNSGAGRERRSSTPNKNVQQQLQQVEQSVRMLGDMKSVRLFSENFNLFN